MSPRALFALWALASLLGALLIALPDDDARVFSFTSGHGPAPLDLAGMVVIGAGLVAYVAALALARARLGTRVVLAPLALYVPGSALAAWSVATDTGAWWVAGVALAMGAQAWLAARVA